MVATPGRALAECLALRRTVVPNVREPWGRIEADFGLQKLKLSGLLTEIGYGAKDCTHKLAVILRAESC